MTNHSRNRALVDFIVLPMLFLTVALLGGLRVSGENRTFIFVAPPLVTLLLAVLLVLLLVRGHLIRLHQLVGSDLPPLTNVAHIWMLITLFFASAQAFNSVLPERGLLHWLFAFFFCGHSGTISFLRLTRAGFCAVSPYCLGRLLFSSTCWWRVCIVRKEDGSSAWLERCYKVSRLAHLTRPSLPRPRVTFLSLRLRFTSRAWSCWRSRGKPKPKAWFIPLSRDIDSYLLLTVWPCATLFWMTSPSSWP